MWGESQMAVIDCQVHVYEADHPGRPWLNKITGPDHVTGEEQVAIMNDLGIDGAILVSTFTTYRYDASYAREVHARHPDRFAIVKPVDVTDPAVGEEIADWARTPGAVGARIMLAFAKNKGPLDSGLNLVLAAGARQSLPINIYASGCLDEAAALIARNPDTPIVIDHVGLPQSHRAGSDAWEDLSKVLELAQYDNVCIKLSGACTLSSEPFPYGDIWDPLLRIIDAYGVERCMWGTDWTRVTTLTYGQALQAFQVSERLKERLSENDRAMLMGGSAERIYGWTPGVTNAPSS
jgi:L-fuconolactonase